MSIDCDFYKPTDFVQFSEVFDQEAFREFKINYCLLISQFISDIDKIDDQNILIKQVFLVVQFLTRISEAPDDGKIVSILKYLIDKTSDQEFDSITKSYLEVIQLIKINPINDSEIKLGALIDIYNYEDYVAAQLTNKAEFETYVIDLCEKIIISWNLVFITDSFESFNEPFSNIFLNIGIRLNLNQAQIKKVIDSFPAAFKKLKITKPNLNFTTQAQKRIVYEFTSANKITNELEATQAQVLQNYLEADLKGYWENETGENTFKAEDIVSHQSNWKPLCHDTAAMQINGVITWEKFLHNPEHYIPEEIFLNPTITKVTVYLVDGAGSVENSGNFNDDSQRPICKQIISNRKGMSKLEISFVVDDHHTPYRLKLKASAEFLHSTIKQYLADNSEKYVLNEKEQGMKALIESENLIFCGNDPDSDTSTTELEIFLIRTFINISKGLGKATNLVQLQNQIMHCLDNYKLSKYIDPKSLQTIAEYLSQPFRKYVGMDSSFNQKNIYHEISCLFEKNSLFILLIGEMDRMSGVYNRTNFNNIILSNIAGFYSNSNDIHKLEKIKAILESPDSQEYFNFHLNLHKYLEKIHNLASKARSTFAQSCTNPIVIKPAFDEQMKLMFKYLENIIDFDIDEIQNTPVQNLSKNPEDSIIKTSTIVTNPEAYDSLIKQSFDIFLIVELLDQTNKDSPVSLRTELLGENHGNVVMSYRSPKGEKFFYSLTANNNLNSSSFINFLTKVEKYISCDPTSFEIYGPGTTIRGCRNHGSFLTPELVGYILDFFPNYLKNQSTLLESPDFINFVVKAKAHFARWGNLLKFKPQVSS